MAWDIFPEGAVQKEVLRFTGSEFAPVCLLDQEHMEYDHDDAKIKKDIAAFTHPCRNLKMVNLMQILGV